MRWPESRTHSPRSAKCWSGSGADRAGTETEAAGTDDAGAEDGDAGVGVMAAGAVVGSGTQLGVVATGVHEGANAEPRTNAQTASVCARRAASIALRCVVIAF